PCGAGDDDTDSPPSEGRRAAASGPVRSLEKVVSDPEDLRGRSGTTGRWSSPLEMARNQGPDLPKCCCRKANDCRLRSAPVKMPSRFILSAVTGPTPWNLPTGNAATNEAPI